MRPATWGSRHRRRGRARGAYRRARRGAREHHSHRLQSAIERIQHQSERLERHRAEERLVLGVTQHDRGRRPAAFELERAFADAAHERRAVGEHELQLALGRQAERLPVLSTQDRVDGARVHEKPYAPAVGAPPRRAHETVDVGESHARHRSTRRARRSAGDHPPAARPDDVPPEGKAPMVANPGDGFGEGRETTHWAENAGEGPAVWIASAWNRPRPDTRRRTDATISPRRLG
jgi:hypothetical protein